MRNNMKKLMAFVMVLSCAVTVSIPVSAAHKTPFGNLPSSQTTNARKSTSGNISPMFNDTKPFTAYSETDGWITNDPWVGDTEYAGSAKSRSRTTDTGEIRDVDSIYARIRAYRLLSGNWQLQKQESQTGTNAADASAYIYKINGTDSTVIFYGSHTYKEAGYNDINHELSDTNF